MWVQNLQEAFRDLGKFVIQLVMDAPTQQCERLNQPLDMGVFGRPRIQHEPPRHLGVFFRKTSCHLANKSQFTLVVRKEFVSQRSPPASSIRRLSLRRLPVSTTGSLLRPAFKNPA